GVFRVVEERDDGPGRRIDGARPDPRRAVDLDDEPPAPPVRQSMADVASIRPRRDALRRAGDEEPYRRGETADDVARDDPHARVERPPGRGLVERVGRNAIDASPAARPEGRDGAPREVE